MANTVKERSDHFGFSWKSLTQADSLRSDVESEFDQKSASDPKGNSNRVDTKTFYSDNLNHSDKPLGDDIASFIDHTLLKPDATRDEIQKLCQEAIDHRFATVCVNSSQIRLAAYFLANTPVKPIAVVGFPLGAALTSAKAFEAKEAILAGAREIDMVIHIGALKDRDYQLVFNDIQQVVAASRPFIVKVILETASLTQEEKMIACALSKAAGAAFVKTSTGFGGGGATLADVKLMRQIVGPEMGVKASGGIRTYEDAKQFIQAGATRLGASSSVKIVAQSKSQFNSELSSAPSDSSENDSRY